MILKIRKYGDPVLRKKTEEVTEITEDMLKLMDDMAETMYAAPGIGLAAPQVGISKKIVLIDIDGDLKKIINPVILEHSEKLEEAEEGCLSIPGIYKKVKRSEAVRIKYLNEKGEEIIEEADGLLGRAFQHETDHLNGELFVDKISPIAKRLVSKKLGRMKKESARELKKF